MEQLVFQLTPKGVDRVVDKLRVGAVEEVIGWMAKVLWMVVSEADEETSQKEGGEGDE